jgi:3-methyladenine DNA glycosylase/8-oxoguanine DNA glycosylase
LGTFTIPTPAGFHFRNTVYSHGWCGLAPFSVIDAPFRLGRTIALRDGRALECSMSGMDDESGLLIACAGRLPAKATREEIAAVVRSMLHFECDLAPFYRMIGKHRGHAWMARRRAGRFLRGATFFEDVVKTILTTNCSWSLTESMNTQLVGCFGVESDLGTRTFPAPASIAEAGEAFLRTRVKLGYRAPYVLEFARRCACGDLDVEAFRSATAPATEIYRALRSIKGVGDYAAGNLLRLLGRFDYLGLDSWCRSKYTELHGNGATVTDRDIERHYAPFESWKGLVMWLDLTRYWYTEKFPL